MGAGTLYQQLYGLRGRPFSLTPDPDFLYLSPQHREALEALLYGLHEGLGFTVLSGEAGTGKTTLVHALLMRLPDTVTTAYLVNPRLSVEEILASILNDVGVRPQSTGKADLLGQLHRFLLEHHALGREVLVIFDEAQNLTAPLLEEIRMLSNLETSNAKLLHILLVGQPELDVLLEMPQLRALNQRLGARARLRPLAAVETGVYIHHRLRAAGAGSGCGFTPQAVGRVFRYSRGIPRLINQVCHAALIAGYVEGACRISPEMVQRGWRELAAAPSQVGATSTALARGIVAVLAILTAAVLGLVFALGPGWQ
jgi:general secretion pathway protein A